MRTLRFVFPLALTLAGFAACGGGDLVTTDAPGTGGVGTGGTIVGTGGTVVGTGGIGLGAAGPGGGGGAGGGEGGAPPEPPACDRHVHILLQKSGAVFESPAPEDNWWDAISAALTEDGGLVEDFRSEIELSVSVYSKHEGAESCPTGAEVSAPIDAESLADTLDQEEDDFHEVQLSENIDAPVVDAVEQATELLGDDENAYIVLFASGIPDSCATNNSNCTAADVFTAVKAAHDAGIETRLVYLTSGSFVNGYPEGVANAGVGEGVADPNLGCGTYDYSDSPGNASFAAPENTGAVEQALADILTDIAACD
jgi:hypothetical protein